MGENDMCLSEDYAESLRIGEEGRDATDTIKGFLYQDLLTIELLLDSKDEDKIYTEWVEDILIENSVSVSIYQVKHYPKSELKFQKVYDNMFYQFLKYKLYNKEKRKIKTYCLYHAKEWKDHDKSITQKRIKKENNIEKIDKSDIKSRFESCKKFEEGKQLLFDEVACTKDLGEFEFEKKPKKYISDTKKEVKKLLYNFFEPYIDDVNIFQMLNNEDIEDILLALAVQYVQDSYYRKKEDGEAICMTRASFINYMSRIAEVDEQKNTELIKLIVLGYIDEVFSYLQSDIEDEEKLLTYREIYFSTKEFFKINLDTKEKRFKFLNSISTDKHDNLNWTNYKDCKSEEKKYLEHKRIIKKVIKMIWKILYDIDCFDFSQYIKESDDCFFFDFPKEDAKYVIMLPPIYTANEDLKNILPRVARMNTRPKKWYMPGKIKDVCEYKYDVHRVSEVKLNGSFSSYYKEEHIFKIECMQCVGFDGEEMETKDPDLKECLFKLDCTRGD